ncbi:MAG: choice-of-anchor D domain-containing protein [Planctomycetes bacterium]|nr:choice-of-anchor D domain-containing protein [Planctomycetota bacterium]
MAEIVVQGLSNQNIADGDITPGSADGTDFGSVVQGAAGPTRTFTVRNTGTAALTLGTLTPPAGFIVAEPLNASISAGSSDSFSLQLSTTNAGTFTGDLSFSTNDADGSDGIENPFNFTITGTVTSTPLVAEIVVQGLSNQNIADGDATPAGADGTDFGSVVQGAAGPTRTFTVRNTGTAALALGTVTPPAGFIVAEPLNASISAGSSDNFSLQLSTTNAGTFTGDISFSTNDADGGDGIENPFNFTITGTVTSSGTVGDDYEPDDSAAQATTIATNGTPHTHSIHVGDDVDWVKFTLSQTSNVTIETDGSSGDTEIILSGPDNPATFIEYDDDDGNGSFSRIFRSGGDALAPGTYYVAVNEYNNDDAIPTYTIAVTASAMPPGAWLAIGDGQPAGTVIYTEPDGTVVTLTLKGGSANLYFEGNDLLAVISNKKITVTDTDRDGRARLVTLEISNTTASSSLSFTTKEPTGQSADAIGLSIETITGSSPLGNLAGKAVDLVGEGIHMTGEGYIASIQLRNLKNGADILMPGKGAPKGITLKAGRIDDGSQMTLGSGLASLAATEWLGGSLQSPWATKISVAGDFGADLLLDGTGNPKQTLGNLTVKGNARNGAWRIKGLVGTVAVTGLLEEIDLEATGTINAITAGGARKSRLFAGVKDGVSGLPASLGDFADPGVEIKSLTLKGILDDTRIAAPGLGKVSLKGVETDNGRIQLGIAADRIKSYARTGIRPLTNLNTAGEPDKTGDYVVRLL